jgi:hypothetical protein
MHQPDSGFLGRDGEKTPTVFQQRRHAICEKAQERLHGDQARIACAGAVVARGCQRVEALHEQRGIKLLHSKG